MEAWAKSLLGSSGFGKIWGQFLNFLFFFLNATMEVSA